MEKVSVLCSVLVCTYNRCHLLLKTLNSIEDLAPGDGLDRELVVVNNASDDRTREVVEEFAARSSLAVKYLFEGRIGKSYALNTGIEHCNGSIIAFTDDDAVVSPDWIDRVAAAFEESHAEIVFGRVNPLWETAQPTWFTHRHYGRFALLDYGQETFVVDDPRHAFHGVNVAIRREALNRLGGFRVDKGPRGLEGGIGEDTDLFERALASGIRIVYDPTIVVRHFIPSRRCTKNYHRDMLKRGISQYYLYVRETERSFPQLAGLPRYRYRVAAYNLLNFLKNMMTMESSEQFYHELEFRRFFWLFVHSLRRNGLRT